VPYKAIQQFIEHFTQPGDIVFDGFAGTGMTGIAAQVSGRRAVLCDLSPAATFLASNFCTLAKPEDFQKQANKLKKKVSSNLDPLYATGNALREFTIYSAVVECSNCQHQFDQWTASFDTKSRSVSAEFSCPSCGSDIASKTLHHARTQVYDPILKTTIETKKRIQRFVKLSRGSPTEVWLQEDGNSYAEHEQDLVASAVPVVALPKMYESHFKRNLAAEGISHFHHFYSPRNLLACQKLWNSLRDESSLFRFAFLNTSWHATVMRRYNAGGGHRPKTNTLYVPALSSEGRVSKIYNKKLDDIERFLAAKRGAKGRCAISTTSASDVRSIPENSIDYIFVDPPFGSNIMYSDLNFLWESWLGVKTNTAPEAIENHIQEKSLNEYRSLIRKCFHEFYRILIPGRWMTVVFSNTNASVWNSIQSALSEAGFVVANVSSLDKKQRSINSYTSTTSVKQDLVISAYKPNGGLEARFHDGKGGIDSVWDFVRSHLSYLPVSRKKKDALSFVPERDPRIIFDRMVAWFVRHNVPVPVSSQEFQEGLIQRFVDRDGMIFLQEQAVEYDKLRALSSVAPQRELFVDDERSAIAWLTDFLKARPSTRQDLHPEFMTQLGAGWKRHEPKPELSALLEDNFLRYDGNGDVPSQIHSYLSTNFKDLRGLEKDDPRLKAKAKDRWYVPDPSKAKDLEQKRERALLKEFENYKSAPGRKLKEFRLEVLRAGFKTAWGAKDYKTIIGIAQKIPEEALQEDEKLLLWYDQALTRMEADA
jgi:DNA modification methylase